LNRTIPGVPFLEINLDYPIRRSLRNPYESRIGDVFAKQREESGLGGFLPEVLIRRRDGKIKRRASSIEGNEQSPFSP
jgi:hypothetical protein